MSSELLSIIESPAVEAPREELVLSVFSVRVAAEEAESYILGPTVTSIPTYAKELTLSVPPSIYIIGNAKLDLVVNTSVYFDSVEVNVAGVCTGSREYKEYEDGVWLHIPVDLSCRALCKARVDRLVKTGLCRNYVEVRGCILVKPVSGSPRVWLSSTKISGYSGVYVSSEGTIFCCDYCRLYVEEGTGCVNIYEVVFGEGCPATGDMLIVFKHDGNVVAYAKSRVSVYAGAVE